MSKHHGKFVWYDVMTTDTQAAETFYCNVVGWTAKDSGMPNHGYTLLSMGEKMVAGLMPIPESARTMGVRPAWMGYIAVDDVDDYAKRVKAAGGAIMREAENIPGVGRFAVAADPHGAGFLLFRGDQADAPERNPYAPGEIGWHELYAGDLQSAFAFYSGLFGWTKVDAVDMGPMGTYQTFGVRGGPAIGGMMTKTAQTPAPHWLYYFFIDAADSGVARVTQGGGKVIHGPQQVPGGGWIVQCIDPQGAMFALVAPKR